MTSTETRLRVGDIHLHVSVDGEDNDQTLLFLHGLSVSSALWSWIAPRLSNQYRVVLLDFRGHGRSERAASYVTPDFVNDAIAACERMAGSASCVVIGMSFGGLIAAALAQQRPDLVRAVFLDDPLLVDPAVRTDLLGEDGEMVRDLFASAEELFGVLARWQREGLSVDAATSLYESMPSPLGVPNSEAYFTEFNRAITEGRLQFDLRIHDDFAKARQSREAEPVFDPARSIDVPLHLVAGDPSVPGVTTRPIDIERLRATSPKFDYMIIEGAGHGLQGERRFRAIYTEALTTFLSGVDNSTRD